MADPSEMKFDRRILNRNLRSGAVGKTEYENYIKNLKDVEGNAEVIDFGPLATDPDSRVENGAESHARDRVESGPASGLESGPAGGTNSEGEPTV